MLKVVCSLVAICFLGYGVHLIRIAPLSLEDLEVVEGVVIEKKVEEVRGKRFQTHRVMAYRLNNYGDRLGIHFKEKDEFGGQEKPSLDSGKVYTFYMDPTVLSSKDIRLGVREVVYNGNTIYHNSFIVTFILGIVSILVGAMGLFFLLKPKRKKITAR